MFLGCFLSRGISRKGYLLKIVRRIVVWDKFSEGEFLV